MNLHSRLYKTLPLLVVCIGIALLGTVRAANAKDIHALLIILGNDGKIRDSVQKNESEMVKMLRQLSRHCKVQLTVMKSKSDYQGEISQTTFVDGTGGIPETTGQDIIKSHQVAEWVETLKSKPEDTVLIYYSGHGEIGAFKKHFLRFDLGASADMLDREALSENLKDKPVRLRMLITDTCSNLSLDLSNDVFAKFAVGVRERARQNYTGALFLEHEGFLDITAASPGQFAIGNSDLGGHFTSALLSQGFMAVADTDRDGFLSWQEAFEKSVAQTKKLYQKAIFDADMAADLQAKHQETQEPLAYSLPTRIGGGGPLVQPPTPTRAVAVLNLTSVPSGAEVSIDGFAVGQTPLKGYELETDGRSTKDIEVTVKAEGYADAAKKFKVRRGHPFPWEFKLTKDIPKTITGRDGAEMVLIPAGEFQMGSNDGENDEKPVHTVYLDAFYMDIYEVTNAQYKKFVDANPQWEKDRPGSKYRDDIDYLYHWNGNSYPNGKGDHPVAHVNWRDAMAYAQWAGKRLPTEAEWEKAARGGLVGKTYPWGNAIDSNKANYGDNVGRTIAVGKYPPNGYGLYDMAGNVWEWCLDEHNKGFYKSSPSRNPIAGRSIKYIMNNFTNVRITSVRVGRGGSWYGGPENLRVARRTRSSPSHTYNSLGFRCARAQ